MKSDIYRIRKSNFAIILIALFAILFIYLVRWNGTSGLNYRNIIKSDGIGYYQYFPAILSGTISQQNENNIFLVKTDNGRIVNKYFAGTALLQSPFVLPVYAFSKYNKKKLDFKSEYFQKTISIAALLYLLIGLFAIKKLLLSYNIQEHIIAFSIFAIFFATNLSYYALIEPSMSHVYSFAFISLFILAIRKFLLLPSKKYIFIIALSLAIILLIRPVNIIILTVIPLLFDSRKQLNNAIKFIIKNLVSTIIASILFFAIVFIQAILWKLQTGHFIVWSYQQEGFYFANPHFFDFLFSFRKGWFVYTPFALLTIIIFIAAFRKDKIKIASAFFSLASIIYILSAWWNWYYGDSYGSRVMIDFYGILILLFALAIGKLRKLFQQIVVLFVSILVFLNVFQTYQYYYQIMSHFDMDAKKYSYILGKFGEEYRNILGGNNDIAPYHSKPLKLIEENKSVLRKISKNNWEFIQDKNNKSMEHSEITYYDYNDFSYSIESSKIFDYESAYYEFGISSLMQNSSLSDIYWEISYCNSNDIAYAVSRIKIHSIPYNTGTYHIDNYAIRLPKPNSQTDKIVFSIYNKSGEKFSINKIWSKLWVVTSH